SQIKAVLESIASGRTTLDETVWKTYLQDIQANYPLCANNFMKTSNLYVNLKTMVTGAAAAKGECRVLTPVGSYNPDYNIDECGAGNFCKVVDASTGVYEGFCVAKAQTGALASNCNNDWSKCDDGKFCKDSAPTSKICFTESLQAAGAYCSTNADCATGLTCDNGTGANVSFTCIAKLDANKPCVNDGNCKSGYCNLTTNVCADYIAAAQPCANNVPVKVTPDCASGLTCASMPIFDRCDSPRKVLAAGETCGNIYNSVCATGLVCRYNTVADETQCQTPLALNAICENNNECITDTYCDDSVFPPVCTAKTAIGEDCFEETDCINAAYCDLSDTGTCVARLATGADCSLIQDGCVLTDYCKMDESVVPITFKCTALPAKGEICISNALGTFNCSQASEQLICKDYTGRCESKQALNTTCGSSPACLDALFCNQDTTATICEKKFIAAAGEECGGNTVCGSGLYCGEAPNIPGYICIAKATTVGAACDSNFVSCAGADGAPELYCDTATDKCVAVGATCSGAGLLECGSSKYCSGTDCVARKADADSCVSSSFNPQCSAASTCFGGKCIAYLAEGADCSTEALSICNPEVDQCIVGTGLCKTRIAAGADCTTTDTYTPCVDGAICVNTATCQPVYADGTACTSDYQCANVSYCSTVWNSCQAKITTLLPGDFCNDDSQCDSGVCSEGLCAELCFAGLTQ
ncbi:MAG: hypothetical protein WC426_14460, partial [Sulfuriferula sp.]